MVFLQGHQWTSRYQPDHTGEQFACLTKLCAEPLLSQLMGSAAKKSAGRAACHVSLQHQAAARTVRRLNRPDEAPDVEKSPTAWSGAMQRAPGPRGPSSCTSGWTRGRPLGGLCNLDIHFNQIHSGMRPSHLCVTFDETQTASCDVAWTLTLKRSHVSWRPCVHNFARLKYSFLCVSCASFH